MQIAEIQSLTSLRPDRFETPALLKKLAAASRQLGELKGVAATIPNQGILINSLGLQEAKDSSAIENIVTTHDELFREGVLPDESTSPAAKEVRRYREALMVGYRHVRKTGLLTTNHILEIHRELERNSAGFRKLPGTELKNKDTGQVVYIPPQDPATIQNLMSDLVKFINDDDAFPADQLIKMALIHHQFESIHPFYDGNGRTGRIINVLYLVKQNLLEIPVLYLSRYIVSTKADYYRLLQTAREADDWENWVEYMLTAVELSARDAIRKVIAIRGALLSMRSSIRAEFKFYSRDLIDHLFMHPYTTIQFVQSALEKSRLTATKYLDQLAHGGFLEKKRVGRSNYYINTALVSILMQDPIEPLQAGAR